MRARRRRTHGENLEASYLAALHEAGLPCGEGRIAAVGAFVSRCGDALGWSEMAVAEQCALPSNVRGFVSWLLVSGRATASADYLVAAMPHLGQIAARHFPEAHDRYTAKARQLGFSELCIQEQWGALARACALHGLSPEHIATEHLRPSRTALRAAFASAARPRGGRGLLHGFHGAEATLFHAGVSDDLPSPVRHGDRGKIPAEQWAQAAPGVAATARRYLDQVAVSLRPSTVRKIERALRDFALFLAERSQDVHSVRDIRRVHIEAYKRWLHERPSARRPQLTRQSIAKELGALRSFFERITEWGYDDAPARPLVFSGDLPLRDDALPRFIDDAALAKLLRAARDQSDPFVRLTVEFLARTGLRKGEFLGLTIDAVVRIGSAYWLRVPVGKLRNDRYIPLHPQLKRLLDEWLEHRPRDLRSNLLFVDRGRPFPGTRVDAALRTAATAAGIGHVTAHQLRHTLATQAINRGMSLEALAALLGHKTLSMTLVYARIADRTVADEYFAVSKKVEALYDRPCELSADAEGVEMRRLRAEMHRRMLGNGYCARPVGMDCHFESICESCSFFVTTVEFKPTLERQRDDAAAKGQVARQHIFDRLLSQLEEDAS